MQIKHIATKFLVVLLPLFLVSFIILSAIGYYTARGQLLESVSENAELVRQMTAVKLTNDVERKADLCLAGVEDTDAQLCDGCLLDAGGAGVQRYGTGYGSLLA